MKLCRYCNNIMMSEFISGRNSKSYTAFHNCPKCKALCNEKVVVFRGRTERKERWFNPETKKYEE